ncbi:MAG: hypothetical protein H7Z12_12030 [Rhodospirillaceae bacterium]|nr:hypothetical protein [Rhodospirillales bacterium]
MSKSATLLKSLLAAANGVNTTERQAQARVKTNDYFDMDAKAMKAEGLLATVLEVETEIKGLRAAVSADNTNLQEVYDASLSVFTKWTADKDAA